MLIEVLILVLSIVMLFIGAELALDASEKVGLVFDIPPLVIGLILIGLGTSLPEFFVSQLAAANGSGDMAIGNIVGSNISNLFLVLGISICFVKILVEDKETFNQVQIHLALSVTLSVVLFFSKLYVLSCLVLISFFLLYLFNTYKDMRGSDSHVEVSEDDKETIRKIRETYSAKFVLYLKLLGGFSLLYYGGELLVKSGTEICRIAQISEYIVSAIFIAFGTSFPELVTSIIAIVKKKDVNLILGNVLGSNVFNVAFVMSSLAFYEIDLPRNYWAEQSVLMIGSIILLLHAYMRRPLGKITGVVFISFYCIVTFYWVKFG